VSHKHEQEKAPPLPPSLRGKPAPAVRDQNVFSFALMCIKIHRITVSCRTNRSPEKGDFDPALKATPLPPSLRGKPAPAVRNRPTPCRMTGVTLHGVVSPDRDGTRNLKRGRCQDWGAGLET